MNLYVFFKLLASAILVFFVSSVNGQVVGCLVNNRIYVVRNGIQSNSNRPIFSLDGTSYPLNYQGNANANAMPGYINSNWMSFNYTVTYDAPYGCIVGANTGTQVTSYKVNPDMNVPIDDHIWIVILLTTALTAFYLSKSRSVIAS